MSEEAINDIQKALNAIRSSIAEEDRDTQLATLALLVSTSDAIIQSARKMSDAEPKTKTKTKTKTKKVAIPQTRVVKQQSPQQPQKNDADERRTGNTKAQKPEPPLTPQQQREQ